MVCVRWQGREHGRGQRKRGGSDNRFHVAVLAFTKKLNRAARFRRLARDYERLANTMAGYHWLAFAMLMLRTLFTQS